MFGVFPCCERNVLGVVIGDGKTAFSYVANKEKGLLIFNKLAGEHKSGDKLTEEQFARSPDNHEFHIGFENIESAKVLRNALNCLIEKMETITQQEKV